MNNDNCQNRREAIAALVLGELETPAADEIKNHINTCMNCRSVYESMAEEEETIRSAFKTIDDRSKAIGNNLVEEYDKVSRAHDDISAGQAESQAKQSVVTRPNVWRTIMKNRITKLAAVVAIVIGAGALATTVGLKIRKLYFRGREPDGTYIFSTEPETVDVGDGRTVTTSRTVSVMADPNKTIDVEQKIKDLEEVDLLRKQDTSRELVGVVDTEVNGKLQPRHFSFKYVLSDGREIKLGEGDPDTKDRERSLTEAQQDEVISLLRADEYVTIGFEKKEIRGCMFSFERNRFVLSDGTEVIKSNGRPSEDHQNAETTDDIDSKEADQILNDKREIANLRKQDMRKLIAVDELMANGELDRRVFVYQYQLSDGRTMDLREGDELNFAINSEQRQEWVQLKDADSGEDLSTYEEKVKDRLFVFKRQRFTLSDGTELIWSYGTLKDDQ